MLSTGPLSVPVFTSYGLMKGAFLGTEAMSSLVIYVSKVATFKELGALPCEIVIRGLVVGVSLMVGTFVAKAVVDRLKPVSFQYVLDFLLLISGISLLWAAL